MMICTVLGVFSLQVQAQSQAAYLKAGNECLAKSDPFCALHHFRMALEYGENAAVCQGLGQAEKALHNYRQA
ncbi:MAG: hypothetical protein JNL88_11435, partial [Bacteroidia bacterium]|nr:hypothetical protein [Bacteroidia bacterium]